MRLRRPILFSTLGLIALATAIWLAIPPHVPDPIYKGKHLSQWLDASSDVDSSDSTQGWLDAFDAVEALGTNCIPYLLHLTQSDASELRVEIESIARRLHLVSRKTGTRTQEDYFDQANWGFFVLGERASNAVPALLEILRKEPANIMAGYRRFRLVAKVLGYIGPAANAAVPVLVNSAKNPVQEHAGLPLVIQTLGRIHSAPSIVVPVLIDRLSTYPRESVHALGEFGNDARSAIPRLYEVLTNDPSLHDEVTNALMKIDPEAPEKLKNFPRPKEPDEPAN
jgi:hypothetical protein